MSLRAKAEADLGYILETHQEGFRWPIKLIDPNGTQLDTFGFSNDMGQVIDPDTGMLVSGRQASVALRISTILNAGLLLPHGETRETENPWEVKVFDVNNTVENRFKVFETAPDRGLGLIVLHLELLDDA